MNMCIEEDIIILRWPVQCRSLAKLSARLSSGPRRTRRVLFHPKLMGGNGADLGIFEQGKN